MLAVPASWSHSVVSARIARLAQLAALALATTIAPAAEARGESCDRACLVRTLDTYLTALVDHAPGKARLSKTFRGSENAVEVMPGQGLWASINSLAALQRRYYDPVRQEAAFYGSVTEAAGPALVSLRIKVRDREVAEAETMVSRAGDRLFNIEGAVANPPSATSPGAASNSEEMIAAVDGFFDHLQAHSGDGVRRRPGCVRLENGSSGPVPAAAGHDCATGFEHLLQISAVAHRRVTVVDEKAGAVVVTAMFLRPPGATMPDGKPWKRNLFTDVFTFDGGLITGVYGVMHAIEASAPESTGWSDPTPHP